MKNGDMPVSPVRRIEHKEGTEWINLLGLTKRELFAAMAMQGMNGCQSFVSRSCKDIAELSVEQAEALLAELEKSNGSR